MIRSKELPVFRSPFARLSPSRVSARLLVACMALALSSTVLPSAATARPPSEGFERLVDVGGHSLYVNCTGRGGPTVILEAALANTSATWAAIQPEIARFTTVCSYDRAGLGRSEASPTYPLTAQSSVDELRTLLKNAGIRGPYVLVGHSYGGWLVQLFARQDGGRRVTGVVLVDATPLDQPAIDDRFGRPTPRPEQIPEPVDLRASSQQLLSAPPFPQVPLDVLRRTVFPPTFPAEFRQILIERQEAASRLSCRGRLIVAEGAGHFIHRDRPDLVIASIERVVEAAHPNRGRRLHPQGKPSPATRRGGAGKGRWRKCPGSARAASTKRARRAGSRN